MIDFLVLGHITRDLTPAGDRAGGTALYAAATATALGLRAAVLTAGEPRGLAGLPPDLAYTARPSPALTSFENRYGPGGRTQLLHAVAAGLRPDDLPEGWGAAPIVLLGPVAGECDLGLVESFPAALVGLTPQGLMRGWAGPLPALVRPRPWRPDPALLGRLSALVLSVEDVGGDERAAEAYAAACPLLALTRGAAGATLYVDGRPAPIAAFGSDEADPTGAGDVFAAALLIGLHEGRRPADAARFASAAAALSVRGPGLGDLTGRAAVEGLLAQAAS